MLIEVTQDHINKGCRKAIFDCPVAMAILDKFPQYPVIVMYNYIEIGYYRCPLPSEVRDFIATFDEYGPSHVKPFSFDLPVEVK